MSDWRLGRKVPINVYEGDRPVCQCHNVEDAKAIVNAMNDYMRLRAHLESLQKEAEGRDG